MTIFLFILAYIATIILYNVVGILFKKIGNQANSKTFAAKTRTIEYLIKSILNLVILGMTVLTVLSLWGINILPLLTGVGILGLGFSFGAQTLVKDLIAGFFILVENQYNVGDKIKSGTYEGEVIKITLRLTILRDGKGHITYIPNSQILAVTRYADKVPDKV